MELKWIRVEDGRPSDHRAVLGYDSNAEEYVICYFYDDGGIMIDSKHSKYTTISHWAYIAPPQTG